MNVSECLKHYRKLRGYSLSELANISGVSRGYLHMLESGDSNPTVDILLALASALEIHPVVFFNYPDTLQNETTELERRAQALCGDAERLQRDIEALRVRIEQDKKGGLH